MKKNSKVIKKKVKKKKKVVKKKAVKKITKKIKDKKTTKKTIKKKIAKKKIVKKKKTKQKRKIKRKKKICMEDFYKILNKVQIKRKLVRFAATLLEADVIENIIKDSELKYDKVNMKTQTVFTIIPKEEDDAFPQLDIEYMDDEIAEEGQIFP